MKIFENIRKPRGSGRSSGGGKVAVVHWDRDAIHYLAFTGKSPSLRSGDYGTVKHVDATSPFMALADHFRDTKISVQKIIVLLSRPELDMLAINLPPSEVEELPALIASEVEQQLGEADEPAIVDFETLVPVQPEGSSGIQALAFTMTAKELASLQSQVQSAGFRLAALCSRHLSPLGILRRRESTSESLTVLVHLYAGEAELAICKKGKPILLRSIRINLEDAVRVAEQIWMETERCLTLLPQSTSETALRWYLFATCEAASHVVQEIQERGKSSRHLASIELIEPLVEWGWVDEKDADLKQSEGKDSQFATAANAGAARDFQLNQITVDLLSPKKGPKAANPLYRWGAIAAAAILLLAIGGYFLLSDVGQLRADVESLESKLENELKITAKYQQKADQVIAVENWLADQVDWLSELNELSTRLPDGQNATVRRLTASSVSETATIDLSVQVAEQEFISQLENRIRSAKYSATSKQISQNADQSEYPWQFETRITFPIERSKAKVYVPKSRESVSKPTPPKSEKVPGESKQ